MEGAKLMVMCMCLFVVLVVADYEIEDEFVQQRKLQARKSFLESYNPNPHHVVTHLNYHVHQAVNKTLNGSINAVRRELEDKTLNGSINAVRRELEDKTLNGSINAVRRELEDKNLNGSINAVRRELEDKNLNGSINAVRRELGKKYTGPCVATNPIDQCWRCRPDWEQDRKRMGSCGLGFGRGTTGGAAGELYTVVDHTDDDVAEPKPGTLRWGVIQKEPLWIIFAHSMTIKLSQELIINSDKTIDGRGVHVRICDGAGLMIQYVQNVIIHGIKIFNVVPCSGAMIRSSVDHCGLRSASDGDAISIFGSTNIWVDHVSMRSCKDGLIDVVKESTAITISNCHFTHHDTVMLLGSSDQCPEDAKMQVTVAFNHFGKELVQRMPRCRFGFFHVVNNDYIHWQMYALGGSSNPTILSQGNRFIASDNPAACNVCQRQNRNEDEWRTWSWTSDLDLLINGAVFVASGVPPGNCFVNGELIPPKDGSCVTDLCKFAGILTCRPGQEC